MVSPLVSERLTNHLVVWFQEQDEEGDDDDDEEGDFDTKVSQGSLEA